MKQLGLHVLLLSRCTDPANGVSRMQKKCTHGESEQSRPALLHRYEGTGNQIAVNLKRLLSIVVITSRGLWHPA